MSGLSSRSPRKPKVKASKPKSKAVARISGRQTLTKDKIDESLGKVVKD